MSAKPKLRCHLAGLLRSERQLLANGGMSSNQSVHCNARSARREWATNSQGLGSQRNIRRALIEADLVDCMVALPGQLFYSTQIPVCLWFLAKDKSGGARLPASHPLRDRRQQTLFIDARQPGTLIDRVHRELTDADLEKITSTYHAWRGDGLAQSRGAAEKKMNSENLRASASLREYSDIPGFCKSATTAEIAAHGHVLTPGRYVGAEEDEDDGDPFEERMPRLVAEPRTEEEVAALPAVTKPQAKAWLAHLVEEAVVEKVKKSKPVRFRSATNADRLI